MKLSDCNGTRTHKHLVRKRSKSLWFCVLFQSLCFYLCFFSNVPLILQVFNVGNSIFNLRFESLRLNQNFSIKAAKKL